MQEPIYTTYQVSQFCRVRLPTVIKWINDGKLAAYKTPGGHRRINKPDLVNFLKKYNMPIPSELAQDLAKILVVDDDPLVVRLLTTILKEGNSKYEIASASDGFSAGSQIMSMHPDLVVLDIKLPGIDGYKVCANIRDNNETSNIKILAVTGYNSPEVKEKIMACGADDFIIKPIDKKDFLKRVKKLLS